VSAVTAERADVAIVGGGIMGSALAYWLTRLEPGTAVTVIERDFSYARASSALSAASIRQQFTTAINVRISQAAIEFLRRAGELLAVDGERPDVGLHEGGYLYLADAAGSGNLVAAQRIQESHGADVVLLDGAALAMRYPWLDTADLVAGALGRSGEGWFDGYALLAAFARKARAQGARYLRGEVTGLALAGRRVDELVFADGARLRCDWVVNAAGPWARSFAALAGVELPVHARRRSVYVVACAARLEPFPLLIDPSGFWIRPEGARFITGTTPRSERDDEPLEPELEAWEAELWPALARRIPAFEAARLERAWAGYYEMNLFDQNAILGPHPAVENLLFMNGFSGHGMQQAPIVGRAIAERILHGRYVSLDLSPLSFDRVLANRPLRELNVIG
jgi:FAD-dependent oxidoreductase domain-containing protein 1